MDTADILLRAADVIEERGHTKGVLQDREGRVCAFGALNVVVYGSADHSYLQSSRDEAAHAVTRHLGLGSGYLGPLVNWNNAPERTQQEVVDAFRGAARALKAAEAEQIEIPTSEQAPA